MREAKRSQRHVVGQVSMQAQEAERSGHLVAKIANLALVTASIAWSRISRRASCAGQDRYHRAQRSGKSTLIRLLLGKLEPQKGKVRLGTNLEIAYFDQLREDLDEEKSVADNVTPAATP